MIPQDIAYGNFSAVKIFHFQTREYFLDVSGADEGILLPGEKTVATSPFGRIYNALTGLELRKKILHDIEIMLDSDDRFRHSQAYPKVKFQFCLTVEVYPAEPDSFDVSLSREYVGEGGEQLSVSQTAEFIQERTPDNDDGTKSYLPHPDKIRQEIDAPIPHPQKVKRVGVVDLTHEQVEQAKKKREPTEPAGTEPEPEPLIIPASEIPSTSPSVVPREKVMVHGAAGSRSETVEIAGHSVKPHPIEIPHGPAVKVSIANAASIDDDWAETNLHAKPVTVEDKSRHGE